MRHDLFAVRKSIHIKLPKELHLALREKLFKHDLSMQDVFQEIAELAIADGVRSENFLKRIAKKKLLHTIEKLSHKRSAQFGELDNETLYDLLESDDKTDGKDDTSEEE